MQTEFKVKKELVEAFVQQKLADEAALADDGAVSDDLPLEGIEFYAAVGEALAQSVNNGWVIPGFTATQDGMEAA
jgi:hypothetical protein